MTGRRSSKLLNMLLKLRKLREDFDTFTNRWHLVCFLMSKRSLKTFKVSSIKVNKSFMIDTLQNMTKI
jgi:hypothetical protein